MLGRRTAAAASAVLAVGLAGACTSAVPSQDEVRACLGAAGDPVPEAIGVAEPELDAFADAQGFADFRVIGRDVECLDRTDDLREDRLNVYLVGGVVVAAALY